MNALKHLVGTIEGGVVLNQQLPAIAQFSAFGQRPIVLDPSYDHTRLEIEPAESIREFRAFTVSFDSIDDDNGDGTADVLGIPQWVSQEVKRFEGECVESGDRPRRWFSDLELIAEGTAPVDASYGYANPFRTFQQDWYVRGHLAMRFLAARMGTDAAWNTHTLLNAVPQRDGFNGGIWLDLEDLTGAWAQRFGAVWVMTGPIVVDQFPSGYIGEPERNELPVAIPDALYKIVVRDADEGAEQPYEVLAFIYPQVGAGYTLRGEFDHTRFLTSVDEIEALTELDFFANLPGDVEESIEARVATDLWEVSCDDFVQGCGG